MNKMVDCFFFSFTGHFRMFTTLAPPSYLEINPTESQIIEKEEDWSKYYDTFILKVSRLQVMLGTAMEKSILLRQIEQTTETKYHILEPIDAEVSLNICKINVEPLAKIKCVLLLLLLLLLLILLFPFF
jgi:hypothetical protein